MKPLTNAQKQAAFKDRKRREGYRQIVLWVREKDVERVRKYVKRLG